MKKTLVIPTDPAYELRIAADDLATLGEALCCNHAHAAGWAALPVSAHFAFVLRRYVPDYELPYELPADYEKEAGPGETGGRVTICPS